MLCTQSKAPQKCFQSEVRVASDLFPMKLQPKLLDRLEFCHTVFNDFFTI